MKEATGEANMTIITVVLIGIVAAVGAILIPNIMKNVQKRGCCSSVGGALKGSKCEAKNVDGTTSDLTSEMQACIDEK